MPGIDYFMGFARHAASASKDTTKVGAAIVGPDGEVRLTGYNGPPRGVKDEKERFERPAKYLYASHAEQNAIAFAAREGIRTKGCSLFVTNFPCSSCARSIVQAGFSCIVAGKDKTSMAKEEFTIAREILIEAGVKIIDYKEL